MHNKTLGIALSGGVDSTAAALMLRESYQLKGYFMKLCQPDYNEQLEKVRHLTDRLNIPLTVLDLTEAFEKSVLDYFGKTYRTGLTPNPCVICNQKIKFGRFMDLILHDNNELVGTGHYCNINLGAEGIHYLSRGNDPIKDQSYFLCRLTHKQLSRAVFPLGTWKKRDIYRYVQKHGFDIPETTESQDVCFLSDISVGEYLEKKLGCPSLPGDIVDHDRKILGRHRGVHYYTVGQRRGLGISDATPYYVTDLDPLHNHVIVGKQKDLMKGEIHISNLLWQSGKTPDLSKIYTVRIRSTHKGSECLVKSTGNSSATITLLEKQRGITPGQFAVLYDKNNLIGSGIIMKQEGSL